MVISSMAPPPPPRKKKNIHLKQLNKNVCHHFVKPSTPKTRKALPLSLYKYMKGLHF